MICSEPGCNNIVTKISEYDIRKRKMGGTVVGGTIGAFAGPPGVAIGAFLGRWAAGIQDTKCTHCDSWDDEDDDG